jgi:hypothetical protein
MKSGFSTFTTAVKDLAFWSNPIFIRYCRAKLRLRPLIAWGTVVLILTGFIFSMTYLLPQRQQAMTRTEAAQLTLVPLFIIQCILLMFKGSFTVASGITREGMEGVLDYQRLAPLSPVQKIVGYLFGLPVLDYCLFALTLPFLAFTVIMGQIPFSILISIYSVFATSVLLYHMTAYMAGMIVTKRFLAGFISQTLMFVLYFVLPNMKGLGYVFFEYLTVRPAVYHQMAQILPDFARSGLQLDYVDFFNFDLSIIGFSLVIQSLLFWVFAMVVYRKWRQESLHILGKHATVVVYAGIILVIIGSMMPLIDTGGIFPSQASMNYLDIPHDRFIDGEEAALIPGFFGFLTLGLAMILIGHMTASRDKQMKGCRRANKYGQGRIRRNDDAYSSLPHTLAIILCGALGWCLFTLALHDSHWYLRWSLESLYWLWLTLSLALPLVYLQMAMEIWGMRGVFILNLIWLVALFLGIILTTMSDALSGLATYVIMLSGYALPFFSVEAGIEGSMLDDNLVAKRAFFHSLILYACCLPILIGKWRAHHRQLRDETQEQSNL